MITFYKKQSIRKFATKNETMHLLEFYSNFLQMDKHPLKRNPLYGLEHLLYQTTLRTHGETFNHILEVSDFMKERGHYSDRNEKDLKTIYLLLQTIQGCTFACYDIVMPAESHYDVIANKGSYFGQIIVYYIPSINKSVSPTRPNFKRLYSEPRIYKPRKPRKTRKSKHSLITQITPQWKILTKSRDVLYLNERKMNIPSEYSLKNIFGFSDDQKILSIEDSLNHYYEHSDCWQKNNNVSSYYTVELSSKGLYYLSNFAEREKIRQEIHPIVSSDDMLHFCKTSSFVQSYIIKIPFLTPSNSWVHYKGIETKLSKTIGRSQGLQLVAEKNKNSIGYRSIWRYGTRAQNVVFIGIPSWFHEYCFLNYAFEKLKSRKKILSHYPFKEHSSILISLNNDIGKVYRKNIHFNVVDNLLLKNNSFEITSLFMKKLNLYFQNHTKKLRFLKNSHPNLLDIVCPYDKITYKDLLSPKKINSKGNSSSINYMRYVSKDVKTLVEIHYVLSVILERNHIFMRCKTDQSDQELHHQISIFLNDSLDVVMECIRLFSFKGNLKSISLNKFKSQVKNYFRTSKKSLDKHFTEFIHLIYYILIKDLRIKNKKKEKNKKWKSIILNFLTLLFTNEFSCPLPIASVLLNHSPNSNGAGLLLEKQIHSKLNLKYLSSISKKEFLLHTSKSDTHLRSTYEGCIVVEIDKNIETLPTSKGKKSSNKKSKQSTSLNQSLDADYLQNLPWYLIKKSFEEVPSCTHFNYDPNIVEQDLTHLFVDDYHINEIYKLDPFIKHLTDYQKKLPHLKELELLEQEHEWIKLPSTKKIDTIVPFGKYLSSILCKESNRSLIYNYNLVGRNLLGIELVDSNNKITSIGNFFYNSFLEDTCLNGASYGLPNLNGFNYKRILNLNDLHQLRTSCLLFLKKQEKNSQSKDNCSKVRLIFSRKWEDTFEDNFFDKNEERIRLLIDNYSNNSAYFPEGIDKSLLQKTKLVEKLSIATWNISHLAIDSLKRLASRQFLESYIFENFVKVPKLDELEKRNFFSIYLGGYSRIESTSEEKSNCNLFRKHAVSFELTSKLEGTFLHEAFVDNFQKGEMTEFNNWIQLHRSARNFNVDISSKYRMIENRSSSKLENRSVSQLKNPYDSTKGDLESFRSLIEYGTVIDMVGDIDHSIFKPRLIKKGKYTTLDFGPSINYYFAQENYNAYIHSNNLLKWIAYLQSNLYHSVDSAHFIGNKRIYTNYTIFDSLSEEAKASTLDYTLSRSFLHFNLIGKSSSRAVVHLANSVFSSFPRDQKEEKTIRSSNKQGFTFDPMKKKEFISFLEAVEKRNHLSKLNDLNKITFGGVFGISEKQARIQDRDIYPSHYGRICLVQSPESSNVGIVNYITVNARVNFLGQIEVPYYKVAQGKRTNEIIYLPAQLERHHNIAVSSSVLLKSKEFSSLTVLCRIKGNSFKKLPSEKITLCEIGQNFMLSPVGGFIPFVEHNDTTRVLMGANMQTQALELMKPEHALIKSGLEAPFSSLLSKNTITSVTYEEAFLKDKRIALFSKLNQISSFYQNVAKYQKFYKKGSDQNRNIIKENIVNFASDKIQDGVIEKNKSIYTLAQDSKEIIRKSLDSTTVCHKQPIKNEVSLGQNVLVGFLSGHGNTFEDSIMISDRLIKEGFFSHGQKYLYEDLLSNHQEFVSVLFNTLLSRYSLNVINTKFRSLLLHHCIYWSEPQVKVNQNVYGNDVLIKSYIQVRITPKLISFFQKKIKGKKKSTNKEAFYILYFLWNNLQEDIKMKISFQDFQNKDFFYFPPLRTNPLIIHKICYKGEREGKVTDMKYQLEEHSSKKERDHVLSLFLSFKKSYMLFNKEKLYKEIVNNYSLKESENNLLKDEFDKEKKCLIEHQFDILANKLFSSEHIKYNLLARTHILMVNKGSLLRSHESPGGNYSSPYLDIDYKKITSYTNELKEEWFSVIKEMMDYFFFQDEKYPNIVQNLTDIETLNFLQEHHLYFVMRDSWIEKNRSAAFNLNRELKNFVAILIGKPYYGLKLQTVLIEKIAEQVVLCRDSKELNDLRNSLYYKEFIEKNDVFNRLSEVSPDEQKELANLIRSVKKRLKPNILKTTKKTLYRLLKKLKLVFTIHHQIEFFLYSCNHTVPKQQGHLWLSVFQKESLRPGDKLTGRYGNKGIVSRIVSSIDMPYLKDGKSLDVVLNPLGVSSRMNLGQLLETQLGLVSLESSSHLYRREYTPNFLIEKYKISSRSKSKYKLLELNLLKESELKSLIEREFNGVEYKMNSFGNTDFNKQIKEIAFQSNVSGEFKCQLINPITGEFFQSKTTVGYMYMFKLHHTASVKLASRVGGPSNMKTGQALRGKKRIGGQKYGEMELACFQAHAATSILSELYSLKSGGLGLGSSITHNYNLRKPTLSNSTSQIFSCFDIHFLPLGGNFSTTFLKSERKKRSS